MKKRQHDLTTATDTAYHCVLRYKKRGPDESDPLKILLHQLLLLGRSIHILKPANHIWQILTRNILKPLNIQMIEQPGD